MGTPVVILFTQAGCVDSGRVRRLLRKHGVAFGERDASRDAEAAVALAQTGIFGTPLLVVADRMVFGFRPATILHTLEDAGVPVGVGRVASPASDDGATAR